MSDGNENISIKQADSADISDLNDIAKACQSTKKDNYFETALKERDIYLIPGKGYAMLNWSPIYALYKRLGIPEIQDMNVHPDHRRQGIATTLIKHCENLARDKGKQEMGISVGLYTDYGRAQRLYAKMGYLPDGNGVTYDREIVQPFSIHPVDDDLCLMLIKPL